MGWYHFPSGKFVSWTYHYLSFPFLSHQFFSFAGARRRPPSPAAQTSSPPLISAGNVFARASPGVVEFSMAKAEEELEECHRRLPIREGALTDTDGFANFTKGMILGQLLDKRAIFASLLHCFSIYCFWFVLCLVMFLSLVVWWQRR